MSYIVHGQFNGVQNFNLLFLFFNPDEIHLLIFLIFSDRISHSFAPRFETVFLTYLLDLLLYAIILSPII